MTVYFVFSTQHAKYRIDRARDPTPNDTRIAHTIPGTAMTMADEQLAAEAADYAAAEAADQQLDEVELPTRQLRPNRNRQFGSILWRLLYFIMSKPPHVTRGVKPYLLEMMCTHILRVV